MRAHPAGRPTNQRGGRNWPLRQATEQDLHLEPIMAVITVPSVVGARSGPVPLDALGPQGGRAVWCDTYFLTGLKFAGREKGAPASLRPGRRSVMVRGPGIFFHVCHSSETKTGNSEGENPQVERGSRSASWAIQSPDSRRMSSSDPLLTCTPSLQHARKSRLFPHSSCFNSGCAMFASNPQ